MGVDRESRLEYLWAFSRGSVGASLRYSNPEIPFHNLPETIYCNRHVIVRVIHQSYSSKEAGPCTIPHSHFRVLFARLA